MNRRTLLQGVLAFVGLSRFVQAKPESEEKWVSEKMAELRTFVDRTKSSPSGILIIGGDGIIYEATYSKDGARVILKPRPTITSTGVDSANL